MAAQASVGRPHGSLRQFGMLGEGLQDRGVELQALRFARARAARPVASRS